MTTEMARMNVELQSKVTDALMPEQQTALKKYQTDQIRKAGGFAAMKLNMQEAGTPLTVEQEAHDVATFLMWTAEPHMEARKRIGLQVFVFLIIFAGLMYFTKKRVWANAH